MTLGDAWEQHASEWIRWARASPHDGFAKWTWPQLRAVLPSPCGLAIEIGCGEGRVGHELSRLGHEVIGVEQSPTLARAARRRQPPLRVLRGDAASLPIADGVAGLVVACMSLQDIDDLAAAIGEAARVLRDGGHMWFAIVHPLASAEDRATWDREVAIYREPYLRERRIEDHIERDEWSMTFISQHRPLSAYLNGFAAAGFMLTELREFGDRPIPWLLVARLEKVR